MNSNNIQHDNNDEIEQALAQVLQGKTSAYEVVVRQLERPLRTWLAAQSPPGVDVDEIAQQSFITAYRQLADYQLGSNFSAWLFTIASYQLKTETTRLRRIADYHARYAPAMLQQSLERRSKRTPESWGLRLEQLQKCLETLGETQRRFIVWRYTEEIPLEEMATRCGRSVAAVKKQLWQLRQKLQQCVESRMASAEGGKS